MTILDFARETANNVPAARGRGNGAAQDRPRAKLWVNVGVMVNGRFINLPVGIPLDTMEPAVVSGQSEDWIKLQSARNGLLKAMQTEGDKLEPGAEMIVPGIQVSIRRINEQTVIEDKDNEFVPEFASLFEGATVNNPNKATAEPEAPPAA